MGKAAVGLSALVLGRGLEPAADRGQGWHDQGCLPPAYTPDPRQSRSTGAQEEARASS